MLFDTLMCPQRPTTPKNMRLDDVFFSYAKPQHLFLFTSNSNEQPAEPPAKKAKWSIKLKLHNFSADDVKVSVGDGNPAEVHVKGSHAEKKEADGAIVTRQFTRRYRLPADAIAEELECRFMDDGTLVLEAPIKSKTPPPAPEPRSIPIKVQFVSKEQQPVEENNDKEPQPMEEDNSKSAEQQKKRPEQPEPPKEQQEPDVILEDCTDDK